MKDLENKMQTSAGDNKAATPCRKCGGTGKTKMATGKLQMCYDCHGTGVVGGSSYQTK